MKTLTAVFIILAIALAGLMSVPQIHAWEKANNFPYGKICNSIFTAYENTCRN